MNESRFTADELVWHAWINPVDPATGTPDQRTAIETSVWPNSPYFRLLAWHPESLAARTAVDHAIFMGRPGLRRGERELAATVASRFNGCVLCASVHARFTMTFTKENEAVLRLLHEGLDAPMGERWRAIIDAAAALSASPVALDATHVAALQAVGLNAVEVLDVIASTAFFAWANRLMLSLGEPDLPDSADAAALAEQQKADAVALAQGE